LATGTPSRSEGSLAVTDPWPLSHLSTGVLSLAAAPLRDPSQRAAKRVQPPGCPLGSDRRKGARRPTRAAIPRQLALSLASQATSTSVLLRSWGPALNL